MALQPVPWAVGGGAENSVEGARLALYAATGGARGVMRPEDMMVTALPTPGPAVRIHSGACVAPAGYPGAGGQSYAMREESSTDFPIPATGSGGGATRYLIARVSDPQYAGQAPADVAAGPYTSYEWVSALPTPATRPFPWVHLAAVTQPASTATITQTMIADTRQVANPRRHDEIRTRPLTGADNQGAFMQLRSKASHGEIFPNLAEQEIFIPEWATQAQIRATWSGVRRVGGANVWGRYWIRAAANPTTSDRIDTRHTRWDAANTTDSHRLVWPMGDSIMIPDHWRGTRKTFYPIANYEPGSSSPTTGIECDWLSNFLLEVTFNEVAVLPSEW